jgi:hypothetical protein
MSLVEKLFERIANTLKYIVLGRDPASSPTCSAIEKHFTIAQFGVHLIKKQLDALLDVYYDGAMAMGSIVVCTLGVSPLLLLVGLPFETLMLYSGFTAIPLVAIAGLFKLGRGMVSNLMDIYDAIYPGGEITLHWYQELGGSEQETHEE